MASPPIPPGWRGYQQTHDCPGAFRIYRTFEVVTDTWRAFAIRNVTLANDVDVAAQLAAAGLTPTDMVSRAILKQVNFQNADPDNDLLISEAAATGTPVPTQAFVRAMAGGGGVGCSWPTSRGAPNVYYAAAGTSVTEVNIEVWFDVPTVASSGI